MLIWVQLPLWISISLALRNLSLDLSGMPPLFRTKTFTWSKGQQKPLCNISVTGRKIQRHPITDHGSQGWEGHMTNRNQ